MKMLMFSIMTFSQCLHGLIIGKCFLIQILVNWLKKCYFQKKKKKEFKFIQPLASAMFMLRECLIKSIYNPRKNVWNKIEKSSKIGQDKKSWISPFRCFLTGTAKIRFLKGRLGTRPNLRFS